MLNKENRNSIVALRLERSKEALIELKAIINLGFWRMAANRMYYACYYAVSALLIQKGITIKTHVGAINQFSLHFVKTELVNIDSAKLYKKLFELRQTGDYDDLVKISENDVLPLVEPAEKFISEIEKLINKCQSD